MKKILALILALILVVSMSATAFAAVEFEKSASVYVDVSPAATLSQNAEYVVADGITVGAAETIEISVKQNMMFYNNVSQLHFLGYTLKTTNNNSNGNVAVVLSQGSETIASNTIDKNTIGASIANGIYVYGSSTVAITLAPSSITVKAGSATVFDNVELASRSNTGKVSIQTSCGSASQRVLTSVKVASPATIIAKDSYLMDKAFSEDDTIASLAAEGYTVNATGIGADGIYTTEGTASVEYTDAAFGGAYTIETSALGSWSNPETITFNKTSDGDYYVLKTANNSYSLKKYQNGSTTDLIEPVTFAKAANGGYPDNPFWTGSRNYKITVVPCSDNTTTSITVAINSKNVFTANDEAPITKAGTITVLSGYNNPSYISRLKVYPGADASAYTFTGSFKVNDVAAESYSKGKVAFSFPVAMIGQNPTIVAALYEDDAMTDVKIITIEELNAGVTELFDTSASTAKEAHVKVFVWNSIEGMAPVLDPFVLD